MIRVILGLTFYFTAVCLDLAYEKEQVRVRDSLTLAAVIFVLGPCKMVYAAVMGLCLLIPVPQIWRVEAVSDGSSRGTCSLCGFHGIGQQSDHCNLCHRNRNLCILGRRSRF